MIDRLVDLDLSRVGELSPNTLSDDHAALLEATQSIRRRQGPGHEMLGWLDLPFARNEEFAAVKACARRLRDEVETLVVVGIGGSYLGSRAVLEAVQPQGGPKLEFAGHHLEGRDLQRLLDRIATQEVAVNVISKSGTTTEPGIAFRLLRRALEDRYGEAKAAGRIIATTDARKGALRSLAAEKGYETFIVPDDVGGRFSVLTPVGLLPVAVAGVDVDGLLAGAAAEATRCRDGEPLEVPAVRYAAVRNDLLERGFGVEVLASFHPSLHLVAEWWKQLFGESEGKGGQGIFPAAVDYTTDLHSLGQYLQDGVRNLSETFLRVVDAEPGPTIPTDDDNLDGLNYLAGRAVGSVNADALDAVADAHREGGVPIQVIQLAALDAPSLGSLLYFFEFAVAVSGRLLGVNPFDQPGVEAYKRNLFRVLGKPGS